jgi:hypothetical protein
VRPDGAILIPGGVGIIQYTGEGAGDIHEEEAATLLRPDLKLDPSFGGPAVPARIAIRVPAQRAADAPRTDRLLVGVVVKATTSGPGLARLRVRAGHRTIARSTAPVFASGRQRLRALLTFTGRRYLPHAHRVRVRITANFRDLVGDRATARARGTLR